MSSLVLFKSPTSQIFTSVKTEETTTEWFQNSEEDWTEIKVVLEIKNKIE